MLKNSCSKKICFTGGPGAGKTTIIRLLSERFKGSMLVVPEVAPFCVPVGLDRSDPVERIIFQRLVLKYQLFLQDDIAALARVTGKHVILDRGVLDGLAYVQDPAMIIVNYSDRTIRELMVWYDAVIHLSSLAIDYPEMYKCDETNFRVESVQEAQSLDKRLEHIWSPHPHYVRIRCSKNGINRKLESVIEIVRGYIGL